MLKSSFKYSQIMFLVINLVTLLLISQIIYTSFSKKSFNDNLLACKESIINAKGKSVAFGNELNKPTETFKYLLEGNCLVIDDKVNDVKELYEIINDCWIEGAEGFNFLSNYKGNICIVCADLDFVNKDKIRDEYFKDIEFLKTKYKNLFKSIEGDNINNFTLLNKELFPNESRVIVYYYIEQDSINDDFSEKVKIKSKALLRESNSILKVLVPFVDVEINNDYVVGILFSNSEDYRKINIKNNIIECDYIYVPKNRYSLKKKLLKQ